MRTFFKIWWRHLAFGYSVTLMLSFTSVFVAKPPALWWLLAAASIVGSLLSWRVASIDRNTATRLLKQGH